MLNTMELYKLRCKALLEKNRIENPTEINYAKLNDFKYFKDILNENEFQEIIRFKQNRKNKRYRVDKMLKNALITTNGINIRKVVFGTITLEDKFLCQKEDTYIRKINNWLKQHFLVAIVNKDFGEKNEREHYHFIGITTEDLYFTNHYSHKGIPLMRLKKDNYSMGFYNLELINFEDKKKIRNYLLKLNNHSNKNTSKNRVRLIKNPFYRLIEGEPAKVPKKPLKIKNF